MWSVIITVALKLLEYFLDKNKASKETLKGFYKFLEKFANDGALKSVKLSDSYKDQLKKLEELEELEKLERLAKLEAKLEKLEKLQKVEKKKP